MARTKKHQTAAAPTWGEAIELFRTELQEQRQAALTVNGYCGDLARFAAWLERRWGAEPELGRLTTRDLLDWQQDIEATSGRDGGKAALQTVNRPIAALRAFLDFAQDLQRAWVLPQIKPPVPLKKDGPDQPHWLTVEQERALEAEVELVDNSRDIAMFALGLHGGLRIREMAGVQRADITINDRSGTLLIRKGKGNKQRKVALDKTLRDALAALLKDRDAPDAKLRGVPALLVGQRGPLGTKGLWEIMSRYAKKAYIPSDKKRVGIPGFRPHVLRHTCARRMIEAGAPVPDIAKQLGHRDLKTTMMYVTGSADSLQSAVDLRDQVRAEKAGR